MANKRISDLALRGDFDETCQVPVEDGTQAYRVTGEQIKDYIAADFGGKLAPTGSVIMFGGATAPTDWLLCNGDAVSRTTYAALFAILSTTYGVGDGSTTFNLPDARGVFVRGAGTQVISTISHVGTRGTTQGDQMQGHRHTIVDPTHSHATNFKVGTSDTGATTAYFATATNNSTTANQVSNGGYSNQPASTGITATDPTTDTVNGTPRTGTQTRPANICLSYIIKT